MLCLFSRLFTVHSRAAVGAEVAFYNRFPSAFVVVTDVKSTVAPFRFAPFICPHKPRTRITFPIAMYHRSNISSGDAIKFFAQYVVFCLCHIKCEVCGVLCCAPLYVFRLRHRLPPPYSRPRLPASRQLRRAGTFGAVLHAESQFPYSYRQVRWCPGVFRH